MAEKVLINGVDVSEEVTKEFVADKTLTLPSGKIATIRKGHGRDLMKAQRDLLGTPDAGIAMAITYSLVATLTKIDGEFIGYDDIMDMDLQDAIALQGAVLGENFRSPALSILQPSSNSGSERSN
jgi:hypothetical protein